MDIGIITPGVLFETNTPYFATKIKTGEQYTRILKENFPTDIGIIISGELCIWCTICISIASVFVNEFCIPGLTQGDQP